MIAFASIVYQGGLSIDDRISMALVFWISLFALIFCLQFLVSQVSQRFVELHFLISLYLTSIPFPTVLCYYRAHHSYGVPPPLPYNWIITTTASVTELHSLSIHRHFISTGMILNRWFRASDSCVSKSRLLYVLCANCRISSFTSAKVSPGIRFSHLKFWKPSVFVFKTSKSLVHALY